MKSTWIDYINWKGKIDENFDQVEQTPKNEFRKRAFRRKDALDTQWINYIETEIRAKNIKTWEKLEAAILSRMDEIFPKMKRMTTTIGLRQEKG